MIVSSQWTSSRRQKERIIRRYGGGRRTFVQLQPPPSSTILTPPPSSWREVFVARLQLCHQPLPSFSLGVVEFDSTLYNYHVIVAKVRAGPPGREFMIYKQHDFIQ
jgi:hypothetical protein